MTLAPEPAALEREALRLWPKAQAHWSAFVLLQPPTGGPPDGSIAQIDLNARKISLNYQLIANKRLQGSLEALLAHEVGHHVRYPGTLAMEARLRLLEGALIPFPGYSAINLFTDLMINQQLGRELAAQLAAVYRAFSGELSFHEGGRWKRDPSFLFYLALYEELWRLEPGDLMGAAEPRFRESFPSYRADAHVLAQDLFRLGPSLFTQFLYFLSVLLRYLKPIEGDVPERVLVHECGRGMPSPDDWAEALTPNAAEQRAIERALREGWISREDQERLGGVFERRCGGLPGVGGGDAHLVPEIMAAYYRQQAERFLLRPPRERVMGEAVVPTTLESWEPGDSIREIDWPATLRERGEQLGPAMPLLRTRVAEYEGHDVSSWQPRMEVYLDVSGSMPDPRFVRNVMTLAAQILLSSTIRAGGWVRAVLYSTATVAHWEWSRSELEMSRFLMHYVGGGTEFPFDALERSVIECGREQPIRVVITDEDFDRNHDARPQNAGILGRAIERSPAFVLLKHAPHTNAGRTPRATGARVIVVRALENFPAVATELAFALFPDGLTGGAE